MTDALEIGDIHSSDEIALLVAELIALDTKRAAEVADDYQTPRDEDEANRRQAIMLRLADLGEG